MLINRLLIKTKKCTKLEEKINFIYGAELSMECGQLVGMHWPRTLGDKSEAIKTINVITALATKL